MVLFYITGQLTIGNKGPGHTGLLGALQTRDEFPKSIAVSVISNLCSWNHAAAMQVFPKTIFRTIEVAMLRNWYEPSLRDTGVPHS